MGTQRSHFLEKKNSHYHREIFSTPREPTRVSRGSADRDGWRVGRNPPSVRSSICLIGEPAPQAELIGVYIPFHSAVGARFIPRPALHPGRPGEHPIIVTRYRPGIVSALPHRLSPDTLRVTLPPCGWSFLRTHTAYAIASSVTAHRLATQI